MRSTLFPIRVFALSRFRVLSPSFPLLVFFCVLCASGEAGGESPPPANSAPSPAALLEQVRTKVVLVHAHVGVSERAGTGFVAGPGLVLTSEHVVRGARRLSVWINETPYAASLVRADVERDLAVLAVRDVPLAIKALPLANAITTAEGERVVVIGCHPTLLRGQTPRVRQSIIPARFQRLAHFNGVLGGAWGTVELLASVERGDSGSPVIRLRDGSVIGIVRARNLPSPDGRSNTAWAVPIEAARELLPTTDRRPLTVDRQSAAPVPPTARRPATPPDDFYLAREARREAE